MDKNFIVNGNVIFSPNSGAVSSLLTGTTVKLNAPTAQLLEAFVTRAGIVISQRELYKIAWGEKGANVTPNTLYQNISLLRKALNDVGISGESVTTVRGKGFMFTVSAITENINENDIKEEVLFHIEDNNPKKKIIIRIFLIAASLIITTLLLFYVSSKFTNTVKNSDEFIFSHSVNNCFIYYEKGSDINSIASEIENFLSSSQSSCQTHPYHYFSFSQIHSTVSLIACKDKIMKGHKNSCRTELFYSLNQ